MVESWCIFGYGKVKIFSVLSGGQYSMIPTIYAYLLPFVNNPPKRCKAF